MISEKRKRLLIGIEEKIGVKFNDISLLDIALTHSSYANEQNDGTKHNERLEFLGDSVLGFIVASYLFEKYKNTPEGKLTKIRANIVCSKSLANVASRIGIGEVLRFGHGEATHGGNTRQSNLEDAFEALVGAIYLDQGIETAEKFILDVFKNDLVAPRRVKPIDDFKSRFLELVQKQRGHEVEFILTDEDGPPHDKTFFVAVKLDGEVLGRGEGKSKKNAEQAAAKEAIKNYR